MFRVTILFILFLCILSFAAGPVNFTSMLAKKSELKSVTDTNNVQTGCVKVQKISVGVKKQTANLHVAAGDTGVGDAPVKIESGDLLNVAENGAVENNGLALYYTNDNGNRMSAVFNVVSPTAKIHIAAGDTGVNAAPLKFTKGKLLNAASAGAVEYDSINVYITDKNALRKTIISGSTGTKPAYADSALVWVRVIFGADTLKMPLYK